MRDAEFIREQMEEYRVRLGDYHGSWELSFYRGRWMVVVLHKIVYNMRMAEWEEWEVLVGIDTGYRWCLGSYADFNIARDMLRRQLCTCASDPLV
jgi:hypothetical protein